MGNACVLGQVRDDGYFYSMSRSFWRSKSQDAIDCVTGIESPDSTVYLKPPESMKSFSQEIKPLKPTAMEPMVKLKEGSMLPHTANKWEEQVIMIVTERPTSVQTPKPQNVRKEMSVGLQVDSVLKTKTRHLKERYNLGEKIGHGRYGNTFLCVERETGKSYACKSIAKRKLLTKQDVDDVRREIEIMHHLSGQPNVISIEGAYEDAVAVHVVMELCSGGELFDRIVKHGHYSEKKAAKLTRTIVSVIETCHSLGVMHRDLKPENFLFVNKDEDSLIKMIDFGLSAFFKPGDVLKDLVGSPFYVAPEVICQRYGPEADVWSAGVIVYILLCGVPPFWGESESEVFEQILYGDIDFLSDPWPNVSDRAKDLVKKMLVRDPKRRITTRQVLCHPWVQVDGVAPVKALDSAVVTHLAKFSAMDNLKKMAFWIIAESLSADELSALKELFKSIDRDNSGYITFEELMTCLNRFGELVDESEIHNVLKIAGVGNSGAIDYREFVAATVHLVKINKDDYLLKAFSYLDKEGCGYITQAQLRRACEEFGIEHLHLDEMIGEVDQNNDNRIDFQEFVAMLHEENTSSDKEKFTNIFATQFREETLVC